MLALLNSLIFSSLCLAQIQQLTCISGQIEQIEFGKKKQISEKYCFNSDKTTFLSMNCQEKKCKAFDSQKKFTMDELLSQMGKPGFKLCREIGGKPELTDFWVEGRFYKLDRCLFKDGSFVDSDFLLSHYLEKGSSK